MTEIERVLKVNNVSPTSTDDEIYFVLKSARYSDEEILDAIQDLRNGPTIKPNKSEVEGLHKVFRTTTALNSSEVSNLLGITIEQKEVLLDRRRVKEIPVKHLTIIWLSSIIVATLGLLLYMVATDVKIGLAPILTYSP
jgi:hypothetical protein